MTQEETILVRYRMDRARDSLEAANVLAREGHLHDSVNRLYYACFYAVSALLLTQGLSSSKHTGIRSLFDRECVNSGKVSVDKGRFYRAVFSLRHRGDYEDLIAFESEEVKNLLGERRDFVETILDLGEKQLSP